MSNPTSSSPYYEAVAAEEATLDLCLANVREQEDSGAIDVHEAARLRIACLVASLAALRELRRKHLGSSDEDEPLTS